MANILKIKIHPAIGVARIGNHPTDFYIGPERPNEFIKAEEIGGFKSPDPMNINSLKIKRQAARFRVFAYMDDGQVVELDADTADIKWKVQIANSKGSAGGFHGVNAPEDPPRNSFVTGEDRKGLELRPKEIELGIDEKKIFEKVNFKVKDTDGSNLVSSDIILGECRTDEKGRLIVLGGFGNTGSVKNQPLEFYDDNNYWYDDIADGYVKASVKIRATGEKFEALDAWVICVPPKYVVNMHPIITLYDTLLNKYAVEGWTVVQPLLDELEKPLFYRDIYPIIKRAANIKWVHKMDAHFFVEQLLDPSAPKSMRERLFRKLRKPDGTGGNMPRIFGDDYYPNRQGRLSLTSVQYNVLKKWVNGDFTIDTKDNIEPPIQITADGLDKAALENCVGGAFYPGIEASWFVRDKYEYIEPFRLNSNSISPGDISKQMALPWQADFWACSKEPDGLTENDPHDLIAWWPFSRPDDVYAENSEIMHDWTPFTEENNYQAMVDRWMLLGFVIEKDGKHVEIQRQIPPATNIV